MSYIRAVIKIKGVVQGVGFRPFVYRLAKKYEVCGFVTNFGEGVLIDIDIQRDRLNSFLKALNYKKPPLAVIDTIECDVEKFLDREEFIIKQSLLESKKTTSISPDICVCENCLEEFNDNHNRRYRYYFINCTDCGPRYSITKTLPYDRKNSSMSDFEMCLVCKKEYEDPLDRRYHAQPVSCYDCGPEIFLKDKKGNILQTGENVIKDAVKFIKKGKILAFKGLGGFHLICDATNSKTIKTLRGRKKRAAKPFAVMFKNILHIQKVATLNQKEKELILSKEKPIVVVKKRKLHRLECSLKYRLSSSIAPGIDRIGVFLPYTPMHHLLFLHNPCPLVATSANLSDEAIIKESEELIKKLGNVVDYIVDYNREIVNACDDSVVQVINDKKETIRLARGLAPKSIKLPFVLKKKILAVGANQKNSIALAFEDKIILSPHIGDLGSIDSVEYFKTTIETFKRFYNFEPDIIVCDKHEGYESTKWAKEQERRGVKVIQTGHHLSHIYACKGEYLLEGDYLGVSFDGTGYGDDGNIWGGEFFIGDKRAYHFRYFRLLGGEKAIKEIKRIALSLLFDNFSLEEILKPKIPVISAFTKEELGLFYDIWKKGINSPLTSSVGRLFDAVASITGLCQEVDFDGQSGMLLESLYKEEVKDTYGFEIGGKEIVIDKIIKEIREDIRHKIHRSIIASKFINTIAEIIIKIALIEKKPVILSGGVFQNRTLMELLDKRFEQEGIKYFFQQNTPVNDGGIALGQIWYILNSFRDEVC